MTKIKLNALLVKAVSAYVERGWKIKRICSSKSHTTVTIRNHDIDKSTGMTNHTISHRHITYFVGDHGVIDRRCVKPVYTPNDFVWTNPVFEDRDQDENGAFVYPYEKVMGRVKEIKSKHLRRFRNLFGPM